MCVSMTGMGERFCAAASARVKPAATPRNVLRFIGRLWRSANIYCRPVSIQPPFRYHSESYRSWPFGKLGAKSRRPATPPVVLLFIENGPKPHFRRQSDRLLFVAIRAAAVWLTDGSVIHRQGCRACNTAADSDNTASLLQRATRRAGPSKPEVGGGAAPRPLPAAGGAGCGVAAPAP